MGDDAVGIIAIFCTIGLPIVAWIVFRMLAHRERMEMIRHGLTPRTPWTTWQAQGHAAGAAPPKNAPPPQARRGGCEDADDPPHVTLRKGIRLAAIGLALTVGLSFIGFDGTFRPGPWLLFGLIPMFVGLSQVLIAMLSGATFAPFPAMGPPPGPFGGAAAPEPGPISYEGPYAYRPSGDHPELQPPLRPPERR